MYICRVHDFSDIYGIDRERKTWDLDFISSFGAGKSTQLHQEIVERAMAESGTDFW